MIRALWTAASGMQAQQKNIDVVANNLANVNTTGFKRSRADFQDLMYQNLKSTGSPATNATQVPTGIQIGLGTRLAAVTKIFAPGDFSQTGNELDIAIEGDGFFQIQQPDGTTGYSRAGAFKRDSQGRIVTTDGNPLLPEIVIPSNATKINIGSDGTVSVQQAGQSAPTTVGSIQLAAFSNPAGLSAQGKNIYLPSDASGTATTGTPGQNGLGTVTQGLLEMSNVNVAEEMVNMIVGQRAYEINSKAVQASDEMLQTANNMRR
ncbi:MAG: flagellar basal body rod protein FlgG [Geobacteraceae bacterium GWC2_55_20]|nr:flagellar basal-body rod protein FlgG [Deltaproteobacteria bacterium]OGU08567.1 MAG: flagellar basal body rod protein FlgG [Geobacteraceae bacterium GWC2_55_20]OGU18966.1 MAG: flagellar basal body rod protein FlgG [Geobacteraceae bacterium GWF2_54_21]HBA70991.1 flagellar basal body rod protein FlgG [Geobacter sp.]HCE69572.1 flagellar basal body rod protein FlgG [Geobacter sp.]